MKHILSNDDRSFRAKFEACQVAPEDFDHRAHVRLAYAYLAEHDDETALASMRTALRAFLDCHGISPSKYHETMTQAWLLAVRHFMVQSAAYSSAADFIEANLSLLDTNIMRTHYSAETIFSDEARERFVEPDLNEIPRHEL